MRHSGLLDSNNGIQRGWRPMEEFVACFAEVADPRQDNVRHDLHEVLIIALCTMVCGGEDCSDMALFGEAKEPFLRQFLRLWHGIPSHDTFSRLFRRLDPAPFQAGFVRFMERFAAALPGVVAIDGKTLRRSFDRASGKSPLHRVHAWAADQRLLLGEIAVDDKSHEITAVPKLLEILSLKGCIVTADVLNCQRTIAAKVTEQGGDYVLALKGNQSSLHDDIRSFLDDPCDRPKPATPRLMASMAHRNTHQRGLGRHRLAAGPAYLALACRDRQVTRTREIASKSTTETSYYLLSTSLGIVTVSDAISDCACRRRRTRFAIAAITTGFSMALRIVAWSICIRSTALRSFSISSAYWRSTVPDAAPSPES